MADKASLTGNLDMWQAFFSKSPAATMVVDKSSRIILVNPQAEKVTGYSAEELEGGKKWLDMVISEDRDPLKNHFRILKADGLSLPENLECRFVDRHGNLKTSYLSGFYHQELQVILLSLIDITEQKNDEKKLKSAKASAETADRLKTTFLGNLSHEIRTPMNAIVGFASLMQMEELSEEKKRLYLTQIISGSRDLLQLIEKTVVLSRIDLGQIKINNRPFFVNKRLGELYTKYADILQEKDKEHIELHLEAGRREKDFVIQTDPIRVMEVLNNLLENAVKFTNSGSITLGYAYLEEESEGGYDSLLFYVKDTGTGIPKDNHGIIFDRFVKMVDRNETVLRGAGLGLAIAKEMIHLMGGEIWVESTPGEGSKFYFTLPISFSRKQREERQKITRKTYENWSSFQVLVAEDMESNYLYIKELLAPTKINILRARDGLEAVELFEKHPGIDVVLMDILMPGLDGYEAATKIREIREDVPVVAQTAFTFEGEVQNGLYAGCFTDYIMKPFTRDMLLAYLKKHLT